MGSKEIKAKNNEQERNIRIKENEESFVVSKENSQPQIEKHLIQMEHKTENTTIQNIDSEAQSSIRPTSIDKDNRSTVESSRSVSVCSLVDREQTSQTVLPNDAKQTINPVKAEKVIENEEEKNILKEEWANVQNLVSFSEKFLQKSDVDSERSSDNEMKIVSENIDALKTAITHGDAVTAQKVIITIITKITILIEI